MIHFT